MQKIVQIIFVAASITLASCGAKTGDTPALKEKKAKLEELKKQQASLTADISKLEAEIAKTDPGAAKEEKAKLVAVSTITPATFTHYIDLQGKVDAVNISYVSPKGSPGVVKALYIKKGDVVSKGELLLKLDDVIAKQNLVASEQNLESVKTSLAFAKTLYQKQKNLWAQNIGTEVQLITYKNNVETLENQLQTLQQQLKITREQLLFTNVYAEVSGIADEVNVRIGEIFTGVAGASPQIKIVNTSNLKVTTQVPENYLGKVKVGTPVKITLPDVNKYMDAKITVAGNLIDANNRSFFVEAKIPSGKDFYPNQIALVKIQDYTAPNAITIPVNTLQNDEKGKYVMVAVKENGKLIAKKKTIITGLLYGDQLEIKGGLTVGDQVITDGYQSLYDGQVITTADVK